MNLFKNLLFLHGYLTDPRMDDDADYASGFGNRVASERAFGPSYGRAEELRQRTPDEACAAAGCA